MTLKKLKKQILILIILVLINPLTLYADRLDIKIIDRDLEVKIRGEAYSPVSISIRDGRDFVYLDQVNLDENGNHFFTKSLESGKKYDLRVNTSKKVIDKSIEIGKKDSIEDREKLKKVSLLIRGYKGNILSLEDYIKEGESLFDFTIRSLNLKSISYENSDSYISAIDGQKEFDKGARSGWVYSINGKRPDLSSDDISLKPGDSIVWEYIYDYEKEVNFPSDKNQKDKGQGEKDKKNPLDKKEKVKKEEDKKGTSLTSFKDYKEISDWAQEAFKEAVDLGFIEGNQGKLRPKDKISRSEYAKILVKALELEASPIKYSYKDLNSSHWSYDYVNTLSHEKLVEGYKGKFYPKANIKREELASILGRSLEEQTYKESKYRDDLKISPWAKNYVYLLRDREILIGSNNYFRPKDHITREEALVSLMRYRSIRNKKD